jgi:glycosyltransferase involved in cell wall biosynthesis
VHVLQVIPAYHPAVRYGGPIRSVHELSASLVRRGHEVHVFTTNVDGPDDVDAPLDRPMAIDGVQVHYFAVPLLRRLYFCPAMDRRLRETIGSFDVVHLHSLFLWPTWSAAREAQRAGVPYVVSPRGMLVGELIRRRNRWLKWTWIHLIERHSLARAAALHATSDLEAAEAQALGLALPGITCVPNGVRWPQRPLPLERGPFAHIPRPYVLFLSRINWKKGLDRLISAWRWVPELHLVIAGNDEESYRPRLEAEARSHGIDGRIHFVGPVRDEHKWALYENADVFVLPSYSENFGNVVAEAMAMSCPVVVTPEVGLAELVRAAGAGVVTSGEPRALAQTVCALHSDCARRRAMGAAGRRLVVERLSWAAVAQQMERLYAIAMSSRRVAPRRAPLGSERGRLGA